MMGKLNRSVPNRFYQQVKLFPDHTALISKDTCLSYKELNRTANRVAHAILKIPRWSNRTVGLLLEHDAPLIAAVLGALKAGKTYVPLDPSFPRDMLRYMVSNSGAFALITDDANRHLAEELAGGKQYIVNIDRLTPGIKDRNPRVWISPFDHAYIIYTSGSSGQPKGVLHTHRNILRMAADSSRGLGIGPGDRVSMLSSAGFSMSVIDTFSALLTGAALCVFDIKKNGPPDPIRWLARENITHYQSTTTVFSHLLEPLTGNLRLPALRVVKLGGEPVFRKHWELFKRLFPSGCLLVNGYGLSEILIITQFPFRNDSVFTGERLPAGFVTPGCDVLLLDEDGKPVKPGETGEIVIKSDYLFRGYWKRPDLTKKVLRRTRGRAKIFFTGDMGRKTPDGCIHILGRKDFQVKIQGVRVEPEAIEALLCLHNRVKQALVNAVDDGNGGKRLTAMVVPHEGKLPSVEGLKTFLRQKLPPVMIPPEFQLTAALPLTPSNKLDRKAVGSVFYFLPGWKRGETPLPRTDPLPDSDTCWVVFADHSGLGDSLVKRLRDNGKKVVVVKAGNTCEKQSDECFTIRPHRGDDYFELANRIKEAGLLPVKIVYLWTIRGIPGIHETLVHSDVERALHGPVYLVQSFSLLWNHKLQIELVGESLSRITGEERPRPSASLILGPFRVIPHEYPHISCRCVDISPVDASSVEGMAGQLLLEFETEAAGQLTAYRNGVRYYQTLERMRPDRSGENPCHLREKGVYLVTGGLGGMGLAFAAYLAQRVHARVILTGRSEFPERNRWEEWLETHGEDDHVSIKIRKLLEIEAVGGEVTVIRADVCDRVRMEAVIDSVRERFGEINGVIHAAGIAGGDRMAERTPEDMDRVLAPGITGLRNLEAVLEKDTPDFLALCSSVTALTGGVGQVDYAAANAYLDAWACVRAAETGRFIVSINWDTWGRVGMAADYYADKGFSPGEHPRLRQGLTTGEGIRALEEILHFDFPRVVVSKRYFESPVHAAHPVYAVEGGHPYTAPRKDVEFMLVNIWEKVLKIDRVGIRDHFFNLGGDSLAAAAVFSEIETVLGIPLAPGTLVQSPTVEALGKALKERNWKSRWKYLVAVQPYGRKRPFFCVHPLSGNVLGFADLRSYLPPDRPFYAVQAAGLNGGGDPVESVEIMAANYLREIRAVQPEGPYLLGGRCFGGLVAFEMAQQLAAEGQKTALLVIMDGVPPKFGPGDSEKSPVSPDVKSAVTAQDHRFNRVLLAHMRARFNYYARPYPGELVFLASRQLMEKHAGGPLGRWRKAADRGVFYHEIPCHHHMLLRGPHAAQTAELLKHYLDRSDNSFTGC